MNYLRDYLARRECPDGAFCHHNCDTSCWRVSTCVPLSVRNWDDWPEEIKAANPPVERSEPELRDRSNQAQFGPSGR